MDLKYMDAVYRQSKWQQHKKKEIWNNDNGDKTQTTRISLRMNSNFVE